MKAIAKRGRGNAAGTCRVFVDGRAADADTRGTGDRRILISNNIKQGLSESARPQAVAPIQASGGAMYGWQAAVATDGKGAKSVRKGTENSKLVARNCAYLRISARKCGFGGKSGQNNLGSPVYQEMGR